MQPESVLALDIGLVNGDAVSDPVGHSVTVSDYADSTCAFRLDNGSGVEGSLLLTVYLSANAPFSSLLDEATTDYKSAGKAVAGAGSQAVLYYVPGSPLDAAELLATNGRYVVAVQIAEASLSATSAQIHTITVAKALLAATS